MNTWKWKIGKNPNAHKLYNEKKNAPKCIMVIYQNRIMLQQREMNDHLLTAMQMNLMWNKSQMKEFISKVKIQLKLFCVVKQSGE